MMNLDQLINMLWHKNKRMEFTLSEKSGLLSFLKYFKLVCHAAAVLCFPRVQMSPAAGSVIDQLPADWWTVQEGLEFNPKMAAV